METLSNLAFGFGVAFTWQNIVYCFIGCFLGTLVGVLPGIGPVATVAMLLPFTFGLGPAPALIMLAGIYYGAQYGGSTTAILVNIPGESSAVVTTLDGYQMARRGRAGPALGIAAIGSFVAGSIATLVVAFFAPLLAEVALSFGPADYFSLMVFGLIAAVVLARGSLDQGDRHGLLRHPARAGRHRREFRRDPLCLRLARTDRRHRLRGAGDGVLRHHRRGAQPRAQREAGGVHLAHRPRHAEPRRPAGVVLVDHARHRDRLGAGHLPGGGALLASFAAYMVEKKVAKPPRMFGEGDIRGVAAPESANNAGAQTSFIPMLTLGIPSNPTMALMIGALMIQGIAPGPQVMTERPELFWGLIASMWLGNFMLLVLNLPLVGLWVRLLSVPYRLLFPAIFVFCCIGAFTVDNKIFDIYALAALTAVAYVLLKLDCEPAPMVLGFILGPMMEENLRRTMMISFGDPSVFFTRPISLTFLVAAALLLIVLALPTLRAKREEAMQE